MSTPRKILRATYKAEDIFKLPPNLDLRGADVERYFVIRSQLHVVFKDGRQLVLVVLSSIFILFIFLVGTVFPRGR
jgi:hypothetical protein